MARETEATGAKGQGAMAGCLVGWGMSGCLLSIGALLCVTGVGAIIGIPLIIVGLAAPLFGPLLGLTTLKGRCPWCDMATMGNRPAFNCHVCKHRIVIKGKHFVRVD